MMSESSVEVLIDRIVSCEECGEEFVQFETAAARAPSEWERLARALRDELQMRAALHDAIDGGAAAEIEAALEWSREAASGVRSRAWSGWAVAAAVTVALTIALILPRAGETLPTPMSSGSETAAHLASLNADEALDRYMQLGEREGRVIEELPTVLVDSFEADDGGLVVYYLRQFLERERISDVYELALDEHGSLVPVPVSREALVSEPSSL